MADFPRGIQPRSSTPLVGPGALVSIANSGKVQTRGAGKVGFSWTETYQPLDQITGLNARNWLAKVNYFFGDGIFFDIAHYAHLVHQGLGSGTPLVDGAGQTGLSLNTDTWSGSNNVLKSGDIIKIAGLDPVFMVRDNAPNINTGDNNSVAPLFIFPAILNAPADNAVITYTGVLLRAYIVSMSLPMSLPSGHTIGGSITFAEAP